MRDLEADLATCNAATPGPWERNEKPSFGDWWVYVGGQHICLLPADKKGTHYGEMFKANAEFIAAAREGWPHAIERAIKAEAEVERLQKALEVVCADLACDDACPDHEGADWPECQNCPGRHGEIHQDTDRDIRCWMKYYQGQALAELDEEDAHD